MATSADTSADTSQNVDELIEKVKARVAELLDTDIASLDEDEELMDQGLDSVRLVEIVSLVRAEGFQADFADLAEDSSLSAWRELLADLAS
ncbi:MAG TPA: isochorismatase [Candidatus Corynebacterium faecigallinarum]|uniref:Isochorismatase n=2 Tax=Corynebacterium TaxID=1716 RepID=A0A9D1RLV1_9CORY|nr:isochorismatase [Candidatus Corynebacterium avicola]HJC84285.1 isochorismatase [Candidatus Corynebacterium faecigallinarum]